MITLLIIITAFFLLFSGALVVPLQLEINSKKEKYRVRLYGYTSTRLITNRHEWMIRIWIFFIPFRYFPFRSGKRRESSNEGTKKSKSSKRKKKMRRRTNRAFIKKLPSCFKIKKLKVEMDTGDFPLNAQLFPLAQTISSGGRQVSINFENHNSIDLLIETRLYKILWITIQTFLINKNQKSWKIK